MKKSAGTFLLILAVLAGLMLGGCGAKAPPEEDNSAAVETAAATAGSMESILRISGTITPLRRSEIKSRIAGTVQAVTVMEGDRVRAGQLLIQLDPRDLAAQVAQAEAAVLAARSRLSQAEAGIGFQSTATQTQIQQATLGLAQAREGMLQARASYENAKRELDRAQTLFDKGASSRQQLDGAQLQHDLARSRLEAAGQQVEVARQALTLSRAGTAQDTIREEEKKAARAGLAQAQANLDYVRVQYNHCFIKAPIDGVVTAREVEPGETVGAGGGSYLMEIADNSTVYLEGNIGEEELGNLCTGCKAQVRVDALPGKLFNGRVAALVPQADSRSRSFKVRINVPDPADILRSGMFARAELVTRVYKGILVARQQVVRSDQGPYVMLVKGGKAHKVPVKVLFSNEEQAIISNGLNPGDQIVSRGQEMLEDGQAVHLTNLKDKS